MKMTQDQLDAFWLNGFVSCGQILGSDEIDVLRREYDAEFDRAWREDSLRNLSIRDGSGPEEKRGAPAQMLQIMQMCERNIHFRKLLYHEAILDLAEDLVGPNLMLFHDQALYKPARTGGPVLWHQDNAYWRCRPALLISCWITLDDVDRDNGAMHFVPGTHLQPVGHERGQGGGPLLDVGERVDPQSVVVVPLPAGGGLFHHCQTLHYTPPNATDRQRRAFVIHFMQPGTRNAKGEVIRPGFKNPILRVAV